MRGKHTGVLAILLAAWILAGCSLSSGSSAGPTQPSPAATAQPQPAAEPLAVSVSPERSCYQQLYDQPDNPNWALYAEMTITNHTDQPLTIETIFLYPNHQFYGEDASTPVLLPEDATVTLRETGLWELHADQLSLDSCPVRETWPFGENQLDFSSGTGSRTVTNRKYIYPRRNGYDHRLADGSVYAGLYDICWGFQLLWDGHCPQRNGWGTFQPSAGDIDNIQVAESLSRFLESSRLLLWLTPSAFVGMDNANALQSNEEIYRAASAAILYLTAQGQIQPLTYQSGVPCYSQEVFEKVLLEMFGQHWDCTGLLQTVQTEKQEEEAIPVQYTLTDVAYSVAVLSQQDSGSLYGGTPESAVDPMSETVVSLTYYAPSAAQADTTLSIPGDRPYKITMRRNSSWEYLPFCFLGIEQMV